jgi:hypothetical protein
MSLILSGTDGLSDVDGSAATPAIRGTDANTGIFFPAADTIAFSEGGAEAVRIDSSGNVGIGTTSPLSKLNVYTATTGGTVRISSNTDAVYGELIFSSNNATYEAYGASIASLGTGGIDGGQLTFKTGSGGVRAEKMRLDGSGNLLVGTTTSNGRLTVEQNAADTTISVGRTGYTATKLIGGTLSDGNGFKINVNGGDRLAIDSSGNLLVGTTTTAALPTSTADIVAGGFALNISRRTTGTAGNTYWSPSDGYFYRSTSSLRYKINVQDYSRGLTDIAKLRPVTFNSKPKDGEENPDTNTYAGFIAEEVHDAGLTEYVQYANDGIPESLSYANMVALLTKAIQEQQTLIQSLTARITALETPAEPTVTPTEPTEPTEPTGTQA